MALESVRRQYRLILAGQKVDVEINALDRVKADRPNQGDETKMFRILHYACLRSRVEGVPLQFDEFCNLLDAMEDLTDDEDGGQDLDPTRTTD
jgi:hypothetical protein